MWKNSSEMDKLLTKEWVKQKSWWGNPELNLDCWGRKITSDSQGYNVYVFGKENKHKEHYQITDFNYVVRSNFTGMFKPNCSAEELMAYVDFCAELGILNNGRSLTEKELKQFYSQINGK
jgi:hypothetical protein